VIESFSLFQKQPARENIQALTDAVIWKIDYAVFQGLLDRLEGLREWGRTWATRELFSLKQHSISVLTMEAKDRYLALIREKPEVIKDSPLKYIASYLGVTDTSLSRIRRTGGTLVYFASEEITVELGRVEAAGGKVLRPKVSVGDLGFIALVEDTESNLIGLRSRK